MINLDLLSRALTITEFRKKAFKTLGVILLPLFFCVSLFAFEIPSLRVVPVKTGSGIHKAAFTLPSGTLTVVLPSDMSVGEVVSGSVEVDFYREIEEAVGKRELNMTDYSLEVEGKIIKLEGQNFTFKVPYSLPAGVLNVALKSKNGDVVGRAFFPVRLTKRGVYSSPTKDFDIPATTKAGTVFRVSGSFDGDYRTTVISVGGRGLKILAESPRSLIVKSPFSPLGLSFIRVEEKDLEVVKPFINLSVVSVDSGKELRELPSYEDLEIVRKVRRGEFVFNTKDYSSDLKVLSRGFSDKKVARSIKRYHPKRKYQELDERYRSNRLGNAFNKEKDKGILEERDIKQDIKLKSPSSKSIRLVADNKSKNTKVVDNRTAEISGNSLHQKQKKEKKSVIISKKAEKSATYSQQKSAYGIDIDKEKSLKSSSTITEKKPATNSKYVKKPEKGFAIQIASVKKKSVAKTIVDKVRAKGYNAYLVSVKLPSKGVWHRIRIGPFQTRKEAFRVKRTLNLQDLYLNSKEFFITSDKGY